MNGDFPKIEIFEPFGQAFEMMKRILFQPFDFTKWLVIGFAAFISGHGGTGFSYSSGNKWNYKFHSHGADSLPSWGFPLLIGCITVGVLIGILLIWITSRGQFIFTDCVVKNRAAIVVPWKEYRREGNSLFFFTLGLGLVLLALLALLVLMAFVLAPTLQGKLNHGFHVAGVLVAVLVGLGGLAAALVLGVITTFMVPVMYRRRCLARHAFSDVVRLISARPGPILLFVLFGIVLIMAFMIISTVATCLTCCCAGFPYVSSVVLLPVFVWLLSFKLLFLRQFGSEFDVWATIEVPPVVMPQLPPGPPIEPPAPSVDV